MAARLTMLLPRLVALVVIWLLAAASLTFAAGGDQLAQSPVQEGATTEKPKVLVVPDVRRQTYVFAKGILQDAGFGWRVDGSVEGYAANTVVVQQPAPWIKVVDNGAPTVVLRLERNPDYPERGLPENRSRPKGTPVVLLSDWRRAQRAAAQAAPAETAPAETAAVETAPAETAPAETAAAETAPATTAPADTAPTATAPGAAAATPEPAAPSPKAYRKPDFDVPGAPLEPADEVRLPVRARLLDRRLDRVAKPRPRVVDFWLYQHSWIVTGARFGWQDGDDALRILIGVDRSLQRRFGFGARSEAVARRALAEVLRRQG